MGSRRPRSSACPCRAAPWTPRSAQFEANPYFREAIRLRYWDDTAKVPGLEVPGLGHYHDRLETAARAKAGLSGVS